METETRVIRISVRNLVEFILRHGDIDNRTGGADKDAMQQGSRIHRKIQRQQGAEYRAEIPLRYQIPCDGFILSVEGRADGIIELPKRVVIDEIKGVFKDLKRLEEPQLLHLAQAKCYAYIYAEQNNLEEIGVQMTYCNLDTEEIRRFQEIYTRAELKKWFEDLVSEYEKWARYQMKWRARRNASIKTVEFPFEYRDGQKRLVESVYRTILRKKKLFIQAPTGVGKTMAAVFPAVKAVGEELGEKIFYLTARTITRTVAEDAFSILRGKGLHFKSITITAKEKMCFCDEMDCDPQKCPYAKGHYDRINDAVYELWTKEEAFDRETILAQAEKYSVCPFEITLDLAVWMDGIVCDYNYVFDPNVYLKRFFGENIKGKYLFLIDEAHNLVDRGREMYSASLCKEEIESTRRFVRAHSSRLYRMLGKAAKQLEVLKEESSSSWQVLENAGTLPVTLLSIQGEMDKLLEEPPSQEFVDGILEFYFAVRDFLNIAELVDENYVTYVSTDEDGKFRMKLFCVNPAANLQRCLDRGVSTVFFSATLLPLAYYRKMLSTRNENFGMYVNSPFEEEKRCLLLCRDVSSRYTRRGYEEYRRIAEYIARMSWKKKGNYMIFFPSYKLMEDVLEVYQEEFSADWVDCICQQASMNEREREEFLGEFQAQGEKTLLGFCVMGGIFSEGIDLIGDRLIGVAVVGTGIPQIGCEREILKEYYDEKGEPGFDYAYRYPGMNKVLQAAGRVIRTREDIGVILLMDERFMNREYRMLFPREWSSVKTCTIGTVEASLKDFWEQVSEMESCGNEGTGPEQEDGADA